MSAEFTILWDCDAIHSDTASQVIAHANDMLPDLHLRRHQLVQYDSVYHIVHAHYDEDTALQARKLWNDPDIIRQAFPIKPNIRITQWCRFLGFSNHVVTTRPPELAECTFDWYGQHLPSILPNIHIRSPGSLFTGDEFKVHRSHILHANFFVEDNGTTTQALLDSGFVHIGLYNQPWNQSFTKLNRLRFSNPYILFTRIMNQYLRFRSGLDKTV